MTTRTMKRERSRAHVDAWGNLHAGKVEHPKREIEAQVESLVEKAAQLWADGMFEMRWTACATEACVQARLRGEDVPQSVFAAVVAAGVD